MKIALIAATVILLSRLGIQFTPVSREPEPVTVLLSGGGWLIAYPTLTNGVYAECAHYYPRVLQGWPNKERAQ